MVNESEDDSEAEPEENDWDDTEADETLSPDGRSDPKQDEFSENALEQRSRGASEPDPGKALSDQLQETIRSLTEEMPEKKRGRQQSDSNQYGNMPNKINNTNEIREEQP